MSPQISLILGWCWIRILGFESLIEVDLVSIFNRKSQCDAIPHVLHVSAVRIVIREALARVGGNELKLTRAWKLFPTCCFSVRQGEARSRGIFSCTPEPHIGFCPVLVHPLFPVFEPHIQKWVIFVRRRPCVCDTFRFESPPLRGKNRNWHPPPPHRLRQLNFPNVQNDAGQKQYRPCWHRRFGSV